jgi:MmyB-like transcription regulator ligand binding domain
VEVVGTKDDVREFLTSRRAKVTPEQAGLPTFGDKRRVAALRAEAGRNPHDKSLTDLVGELATRSDEFRTRWARHNVKHHRTATKRLRNSLVGDLELTGEAMELAGDGLVIITYTAEPDSPAIEAMRFLSSWATTQQATAPVRDQGGP